MKKFLTLAIASIMAIGSISTVLAEETKNIEATMLPAFSSVSQEKNTVWVGTFQLVWNDFMDSVVKGPVEFINYNSQIAKELNKQEFKKSMISEDSYYTAYGETSLELKKQIEDAIQEKFNEKSDILDKIDWKDSNNAYFFYSILKKDFTFTNRFDLLKKEKFNNSKELVQYFGIDKETRAEKYDSVDVLFYNNSNDFAVALKSDNDMVILYRNKKHNSFAETYAELNKNSQKYKKNKKFVAGDQLKVPFLAVNKDVKYSEFANKLIKNTNNLYIDNALQTVNFNMDNLGVKLKSEAALDINFMSMPLIVKEKGRNFFFDKPFTVFLIENGKSMPYFAARVNDTEAFKYIEPTKQ